MDDKQTSKYKEYFEKRASKINGALVTSLGTPYGKENIKLSNVSSYQEFATIPVLEGDKLIESNIFVPGSTDGLVERTTGGTTGSAKKKIYYPKEALASYFPPHVTDILNSHKSALLHKHWEVTNYMVLDATVKKQCPKVDIRPYHTSEEALKIISEYDVTYISEQVTKLAELLYDFNILCQKDPMLLDGLKGKYVFIELAAEPVNIEDMKKWYALSKWLFNTEPDIVVTYAITQTLLVGVSTVFDLNTKLLEYRVAPNKFVEVLDVNTNQLVMGKEGKVVVTPLYEPGYTGSIFIRFDTDDLGTMRVGDDGNVYLSNIHRNENAGMISLYGIKYFAGEFYKDVSGVLGFPLRIQFKKINNISSITLLIKMYSNVFSNEVLAKNSVDKVREILLKSYHRIKEENADGKIAIEISYSTEDPEEIQKGWQILKS